MVRILSGLIGRNSRRMDRSCFKTHQCVRADVSICSGSEAIMITTRYALDAHDYIPPTCRFRQQKIDREVMIKPLSNDASSPYFDRSASFATETSDQ
jgi:hypothetical protein